jgi:SAM-dependent methyltransferase
MPRGPTHDPLYSDPEAYDIAFGWDSSDETAGCVRVAAELLGRPVRRALEVGCGTGRVLRDLARLGLEAVGLDREPALLRVARRRLRELGLSAELIEADMREFALERPVDFAISPINGVGYLTGPGELANHLVAAAANLTAGGVYVIEVSFGPIEKDFFGKSEPWIFERGGARVMADWRLLEADADSGLVTNEATMIIQRPSQDERRLVCRQRLRKWDQPTFYGLVAASPLRLARMLWRDLSPLDPATPLTYADDNVFVFLQK